jgi:hypothetical protein
LYRVITARVTFGNIHALDTPVESVTTIKNSGLPRDRSVESINATLNSNQQLDNKSIDLLLNDSSENDSESGSGKKAKKLSPNKSTSLSSSTGPMCLVDEKIFKVPSTYRCTNYYLPPDIDSSLLDVNELNRTRRRVGDAATGAAPSQTTTPAAAQYHYLSHQTLDDDDILLQLAIQQSLAGGEANTNESSTDADADADAERAQMTALEVLGHRTLNRSGATQSLQQYNQRQANLAPNQTDEEMLLQRYDLLVFHTYSTILQ